MNTRQLAFAVITLLGVLRSTAQYLDRTPLEDPVMDAFGNFNPSEPATSNDLSDVLNLTAEPRAFSLKNAHPAPAAGIPAREPAPVTNTPPKIPEPVGQAEIPAPVPMPETPDAPAPPPRQGLAVRVENLRMGTGDIDPSQVKLIAPFPAKPLAQAPVGWRFKSAENAPPFTREVELSPGNRITLSIRPHILVPDANGASVFSVPEPGFDSSLGFHQNATVSAILSHSIRQLEEDSKQLGITIDKLQQILVSLPKPEPAPESITEIPAKPKPATPRKR